MSLCFNLDETCRHGDLRPPMRVCNGSNAEKTALKETLLRLNEIHAQS